ncbi:hypothetical protein [Bradyrhizobium sp. LHD-71]|uniref:hypothetical protein n=1 Tax=Bradyrhizobium sp. LHD-71 TaxID=3072141 RepID=UPI00280CC28C|nr:hypothetical protein [Bradyrhizobium sp. LHD-71]MDQ8728559.1 hypothetical protein [Bradyrhizobium sp. LHD-71]
MKAANPARAGIPGHFSEPFSPHGERSVAEGRAIMVSKFSTRMNDVPEKRWILNDKRVNRKFTSKKISQILRSLHGP